LNKPTPDAVIAALAEHGSIRKAAPALGVPRSSLQDWIAEWAAQDPELGKRLGAARASQQATRPQTAQKAGYTIKGDEATVTGEAVPVADLPAMLGTRNAEQYLRDRWGFPEDTWECVSATGNEWMGPVAGGGAQLLAQVKGTFRKRLNVAALFPEAVVHVPALVKPKRIRRPSGAPRLIIAEYDHQAPYFDPALDAAATAMHADLQPDVQFFGGDLMDFPTISRHPDHPAAMASVRECLSAGHHILRRRREAAPHAEAVKIKGNHDWRPEGELLLRAERMAGIAPVGETVPALSLRRLMHLDALGVKLVEHPLGWEHAEVELVPGVAGLVARHGWLTGANTAGRSLAKRGRSLLVGHTHTREHVFQWDPSAGLERQAAVAGTMSRVRGEAFSERQLLAVDLDTTVDFLFPHFAVLDNWTQGLVTVTVWPSGSFLIEHARWENGALYWRDRAWRP
jgi:hypothetical protein